VKTCLRLSADLNACPPLSTLEGVVRLSNVGR